MLTSPRDTNPTSRPSGVARALTGWRVSAQRATTVPNMPTEISLLPSLRAGTTLSSAAANPSSGTSARRNAVERGGRTSSTNGGTCAVCAGMVGAHPSATDAHDDKRIAARLAIRRVYGSGEN